MTLLTTAEEVFRLWSAGWPYIHLETLEEERGMWIAGSAHAKGSLVCIFTPGEGVQRYFPLIELADENEEEEKEEDKDKDKDKEKNTEEDEGGNNVLNEDDNNKDGMASYSRKFSWSANTPAEAVEVFSKLPGPSILVLQDVFSIKQDMELIIKLRQYSSAFSENRQCILFLEPAFDIPQALSEDMVRVILPHPDTDEISVILDEFDEMPHRENMIAAAVGLSEKAARRAFAAAMISDDPVNKVLAEKTRLLKDEFALEVFENSVGYDDVGGLESLKKWLTEREKAFGVKAREFGLPIPRGVLLLGVQGCGKSVSAKAVASHWQLPLLRLDLAAVFGGSMPADRALRKAISLSEQLAPSVLWIDEIEKGFAGSDIQSEEAVAEVSRVLGAFTTWLQEKEAPVFVVATANEVVKLPPELLRRGRFDEIFFVDLPDSKAREEILAVHLRKRNRDPDSFPLKKLSKVTEHFSGAELEQVVVSALYRAYKAERDINSTDLERAASETVPLFRTYEERVKALRAWAKNRARPAGRAEGVIDILKGS